MKAVFFLGHAVSNLTFSKSSIIMHKHQIDTHFVVPKPPERSKIVEIGYTMLKNGQIILKLLKF